MKQRLDIVILNKGLVSTRSQAESYIKLGAVFVNGKKITKPGYYIALDAIVELKLQAQYVSRAGLKLASVANTFDVLFNNKLVLDVGSSTGGFTDYALQHGAKKVIAVDVGTNQLHKSLHNNSKIELHEQTDIRDVYKASLTDTNSTFVTIEKSPDIIVIDVSFISLREILPHIAKYIADKNSVILAMVKPQFEAGANAKHKGVIKNESMRRAILKDFELWAKNYFVVMAKADSAIAGAKGNQERFYMLKKII